MDANKKQDEKGIKEMTYQEETIMAAGKNYCGAIEAIQSGHGHASVREAAAYYGKLAGMSHDEMMSDMVAAGLDSMDAEGAIRYA